MGQLKILTDARWIGPHGIGRFAANVLSRLPPHSQLRSGPRYLSPLDPLWLSYQLALHRPDVFFSPGFSVPAIGLARLVFTIHDLIWLQFPADSISSTCARKLYFEAIVKRIARRAYRILTVSEYSRNELLKWTGLRDEAIINVGNGIDPAFESTGKRYDPGFPYILYVGNSKPHKNLHRLIDAFAGLDYPDLRLLLAGNGAPSLCAKLRLLRFEQRVHFTGRVDDQRLAEFYRGALLLVQPSLIEGFGLPPVEAMACGTPAVVSSIAAFRETVGNAAVLVDPLDVSDIRRGIERVIGDSDLRRTLTAAGQRRAASFRWGDVASKVSNVLGLPSAAESP